MKGWQKGAVVCLIFSLAVLPSTVFAGSEINETARDSDGNITLIGGFNDSGNLLLVEHEGKIIEEFTIDFNATKIKWTGNDFLIFDSEGSGYENFILLRYHQGSLSEIYNHVMGDGVIGYYFGNIECNPEYCIFYFVVYSAPQYGLDLTKYSEGVFQGIPDASGRYLAGAFTTTIYGYEWDGEVWRFVTDSGNYTYDGAKFEKTRVPLESVLTGTPVPNQSAEVQEVPMTPKDPIGELVSYVLILASVLILIGVIYEFSSSRKNKKTRKWRIVSLILLLLGIGYLLLFHPSPSTELTLATPEVQKKPEWDVIETQFERIWEIEGIGGVIAFIGEFENDWAVIYDGEEGPTYDYRTEGLTDVNGILAYSTGIKGGKEFIVFDGEEGPKYDDIENLMNINGKLAYLAKEDGEYFVVLDGEEHKKYSYITEINGKLAFVERVGENSRVVYDGKEGPLYESVGIPLEIAGKPAYTAKKGNLITVVYDGVEGPLSEGVSSLTEIGGKLAYVVRNKGFKEAVVFEGKVGPYYSHADHLADIGGKLAYRANRSFIVYDGVEGEYATWWGPIDVGGKLAYTAYEKDLKSFIVFDGEEVGKNYDIAYNPVDVGGELAYAASKDGSYFFVYDGKEGPKFESVAGTDIGGKLVYFGEKGGWRVVVYDGQEIGVYESACCFAEINNKLLFFASRDEKHFIVYDGEEGPKYDRIGPLLYRDIGGKLAYAPMKDGKRLIVMEK